MPHKLALVIALLALTTAAAAAQEDNDAFGDETPEWLTQHLQREAPRLKSRKVRFDDMRSRLAGEISIAPAYADKSWHVGTDIGGDYPVVCFVHAEEMNLANTVSAQAAFDVNAVSGEIGEALSARKSNRVDAGVIEGSPYLGLQYLYRIGSGDDASVGMIKVWAATRSGATLVCKHNELGFRDSVFGLFEGFVREFANRNAPPRPYYDEILVATAGGQPVGITRTRFTRDDDGYTRIETDRSTLLPAGDEAVVAMDRYDLVWSEPNGDLINAYSTSTTDGKINRSLTLAYANEAWKVSGTLDGDDRNDVLDESPRPLTPLGWYRLIRTAINGDVAEPVTFRMWAPDTAPASLLDATFTRDGDTGGVLAVGPVSTRIVVDQEGYRRTATTTGDDTGIVLTRVWRAGGLD